MIMRTNTENPCIICNKTESEKNICVGCTEKARWEEYRKFADVSNKVEIPKDCDHYFRSPSGIDSCAINIMEDRQCNGKCEKYVKTDPEYNPVSKPSHYAQGRKYEPKDVIRDWKLNFNLGSAVKYISRAGRKDDIVQDLKKAQQFIQFEIDALEEEKRED